MRDSCTVRAACAAAAVAALGAGAGARGEDAPESLEERRATHRLCRAEPWREAEPACREAFRAVDGSDWRRGGVVSLVVENDAIVGPDRDYTNGVGLIVSAPPRAARPAVAWLDRAHDRLDTEIFAFVYGEGTEVGEGIKRAAFRLAQQLYTPEDLGRVPPDPRDRPYAAWTYLSLGQVRDTAVMPARADAFTRRGLSSTQFELGVVGPSAGGEAVQREFHALIGAPDPQGWDHQIEDEPGLVLRHERKLITRCEDCWGGRVDAEWERHAGFALGNVDTSLTIGVAGRIGVNMGADYGPVRLQPSLDGASYFVRGPDGAVGGYLFAGLALRAVGRNIFLDGPLFAEGPSVDKRPLVADAQLGAVALLGPVKLSLSHVVRSEEFIGQARDTEFDALGISVRF